MVLLLHPGTPILGVPAVPAVLAAAVAEIRRTKTPYKPAWMPFAEDRYTLLENYTPPLIATTFLLILMGVLPSFLYYYLARNQIDCCGHSTV
jgi:hypothetical protein